MGLDFVEIIMTLEHEFGVEITDKMLLETMQRHDPPDLTPADIVSLICDQPRSANCVKCKYDLRGHADSGNCPECGRAFGLRNELEIRDGARKIIAQVTGISLEKIRADSRIIKDLRIG